ncbi:DUF6056 family protein [Chryseobacterium sp. Leaf394]|uniref:DUF6056 family protein n=1 Tax=Chryseobacterium sp. Leaf394 TaxID=1736361 RepID=UPI0007012741|nr:DUF6056 family protein [Chryseobacterium sp. Leaf394]KQS95234.1 hypothetical protein ASG21_17490 [Chryseobacterium sp. Leaf394]
MKTKFLPSFLLVFINIGFLLSLYWFPVTRDEFYYLDRSQLPHFLSEYWTSYNYVNPRSGQFFLNIVARSKFLKLVLGFLVFNGFLWALFANIFRRFPKITQKEDVWKLLILAAAFIFLINYFGELFYYSPFATNYTFTHVLYLLYLYVMTEYFIFKKNVLARSPLKIILLCVGAFIMGMGNEHVPPVLLLFSGICGLRYLIKNKKLPDFNIIAVNLSVAAGYLALFFAPANAVKYKTVGKTQYGFNFGDYIGTFTKILKFYYYYNLELILFLIVAGLACFYLLKTKKINRKEVTLLGCYLLMGILAVCIISYSPLTGTRLMFFSTLTVFIFSLFVARKIYIPFQYKTEIFKIISSLWLVVFFVFSTVICQKSDLIFKHLCAEIQEKKKISKDVILDERLDYSKDNYPGFSRRILFEYGTEYIDRNPDENLSEEKNLIKFFKLKTISHH